MGAKTVEINEMSLNLTVEILRGLIQRFVDTGKFQILYTSAARTNKMIMGTGICIKMIHSVSHAEPCNLTDIRQKSQITVYSAETDIRKLNFHIAVNYIRSRMIGSCHQEIFDGFPLTAVLQRHNQPPFHKTIIVTVTIAKDTPDVNMFILFL